MDSTYDEIDSRKNIMTTCAVSIPHVTNISDLAKYVSRFNAATDLGGFGFTTVYYVVVSPIL